jgi:hypothetical protein
MFTIDKDITVSELRGKNLVKVFFSMNNHQIATPEMMLEEARSYVMFYSEPGAKVSAYIGLYLLLTGRRLFYAHSSNPFPPRELNSVEDEALCFVEGLGALVDEIEIADLSAEEVERWMEEQEIFSLEARPEKSPTTPSPETEEQEAVRTEPEAFQPSPEVPEVTPSATQPQPEPQVQHVLQVQTTPQPAPESPQPRQAFQVDVPPQEALTAPDLPAPPTEEAPIERKEESTPQPYATQPDEAEVEYEVQAVPSTADVSESGNAPTAQQVSKETSPRQPTVPTPERARPKPASRANGPKAAPSAAVPAGTQDIIRKAIKAGVVKPLKPSIRKEAEDDAGVVRRDREALARLLTSF